MDIANLTGIAIFSVLSVAVISFCILSFFIMGSFKKMKRGERALMVFAIIGVIATLVLAAIQFLLGFLI